MNAPPESIVLRAFQRFRGTIPTLRALRIVTKITYGLWVQALWGYDGEVLFSGAVQVSVSGFAYLASRLVRFDSDMTLGPLLAS